MATLQEYGEQIEALGRMEIGEPAVLQEGEPERLYGSDAEEACTYLWKLAMEISGIAWSPHARQSAKELIVRAKGHARRIQLANGLISNVS